tara:strand:- start:247 stop:801 length:555 start_codon:yes stop_codon:yes gene_type:complete
MRYFKKTDGHVAAFDDDQMTSAELVDVITAEKSAIELTTQYAELLSANDDLSSIDDIESEQYKTAMQRVNEAEAEYKSCDEYVSLKRLKNTKIWIPDDAVEMTADEIHAHKNPVITDEQLAATARSQRDTLIDRVSREIERRQDASADVTAWRVYRQFLRDIPDQDGFPTGINWGIQPAEFTGK